jgi:hypothetical protein
MLVNRLAQKTNLLSVPPTPFAEQQVNAQSQSLWKRKRVVQRLGLKPTRLTAVRGQFANCKSQTRESTFQEFHLSSRVVSTWPWLFETICSLSMGLKEPYRDSWRR